MFFHRPRWELKGLKGRMFFASHAGQITNCSSSCGRLLGTLISEAFIGCESIGSNRGSRIEAGSGGKACG